MVLSCGNHKNETSIKFALASSNSSIYDCNVGELQKLLAGLELKLTVQVLYLKLQHADATNPTMVHYPQRSENEAFNTLPSITSWTINQRGTTGRRYFLFLLQFLFFSTSSCCSLFCCFILGGKSSECFGSLIRSRTTIGTRLVFTSQ